MTAVILLVVCAPPMATPVVLKALVMTTDDSALPVVASARTMKSTISEPARMLRIFTRAFSMPPSAFAMSATNAASKIFRALVPALMDEMSLLRRIWAVTAFGGGGGGGDGGGGGGTAHDLTLLE